MLGSARNVFSFPVKNIDQRNFFIDEWMNAQMKGFWPALDGA